MSFLPLLLSTVLPHVTASAPLPPPAADEWSALDQEIAALAEQPQAAQQPLPGIAVNGWIRTRYANSSDVDADPTIAGDQDLGGFNLDSVRLVVRGNAAEGYGFLISFDAGDAAVNDAASDGVGIVDAYATVRPCDCVTITVGRFCSMFLANTCVEERKLLFLDRSFLDEAWDWRDTGVQFSGAVQRFEWWAAIQNGMDGAADEYALTARASMHVIGDKLCTQEGCPMGVEPSQLLTVGVAWYDDQSMDEGAAWGGDVLFAWNRLSAVAEIVDHQEEMRPGLAINPSTGVLIPMDFSATGPETPGYHRGLPARARPLGSRPALAGARRRGRHELARRRGQPLLRRPRRQVDRAVRFSRQRRLHARRPDDRGRPDRRRLIAARERLARKSWCAQPPW